MLSGGVFHIFAVQPVGIHEGRARLLEWNTPPESHTPWGFWIVVGALLLIAIASWAWLFWKKWLI